MSCSFQYAGSYNNFLFPLHLMINWHSITGLTSQHFLTILFLPFFQPTLGSLHYKEIIWCQLYLTPAGLISDGFAYSCKPNILALGFLFNYFQRTPFHFRVHLWLCLFVASWSSACLACDLWDYLPSHCPLLHSDLRHCHPLPGQSNVHKYSCSRQEGHFLPQFITIHTMFPLSYPGDL